ncbi:MAG: molybdopterin molybdotransferase [Actinomycetota bacterium]|nr:molybdopterin molybdotransferase [Actinomycetota bacterium]
MSTVAEHQAAVAALLAPLADREPEAWRVSRPPAGAAPRVLARDILNPIDLPPFDNSQMDGYAVRAAEVVPGATLKVGRRIAAGHGVDLLRDGEAAPIMTGAPIPDGADAVIPIEDATPNAFQPEHVTSRVTFAGTVDAGTFVRRRGSDLAAGSLLLATGTALGAAQWGVLASSGVATVPLLSQLRVLVLSTGDELTLSGRALAPGHIYDANGASMAAAVSATGALVTEVLVVHDDARLLRDVFEDRDRGVDLVLTTGGVSKGAYEVVRDVFESSGVAFGSVAMQPGGPQGLGTARLGRFSAPVVAFPGNPVSALVSFEMFLRPVLRELHGLTPHRENWLAPLAEALDSPPAKHQVRRGVITASGEIELVGGASSHLLHSYAASTVLVHVPVGVSHLDAGDTAEVWRIDD